jgi:hypothetical protein
MPRSTGLTGTPRTRVDRDHRLPALIDRAGSAELLADVDPDHDTAVGVGLTTR